MSAIEQSKRFACMYWGVLATLIFDIVGFLKLPDCLNNKWRVAIISVSIFLSVAGFMNGSKKTREEMESGQEKIETQLTIVRQTVDGKDAALQREREKNAELAARLRDLTLEENRKRRMFDALNEREKWLLAAILDMSPMVPSSNDNRIIPCLKFMCDAGILLDTGIVTVNGAEKESFTIKSDWRTWLADHADELPDPHSDMPE